MKYFTRTMLLTIWLFVIVAPSVISLLDVHNPVLVTSLNEEEQQEYGKQAKAEEKIIHDICYDFSLALQPKKLLLGDYASTNHIEHIIEILLPPPEFIR